MGSSLPVPVEQEPGPLAEKPWKPALTEPLAPACLGQGWGMAVGNMCFMTVVFLSPQGG